MLVVRKSPTSHLPLHYDNDTRHHRDPTNRNPWQDFYFDYRDDRNLVRVLAVWRCTDCCHVKCSFKRPVRSINRWNRWWLERVRKLEVFKEKCWLGTWSPSRCSSPGEFGACEGSSVRLSVNWTQSETSSLKFKFERTKKRVKFRTSSIFLVQLLPWKRAPVCVRVDTFQTRAAAWVPPLGTSSCTFGTE